MLNALSFIAILSAFCVAAAAQQPARGPVRVTVVDENGRAVAGAHVVAPRADELQDMYPMCVTDNDGVCGLTLYVPGGTNPRIRYSISASKYDSGYPPVFTMGPCPGKKVIVTGEEAKKGRRVTIHLGPKAGIVRMTLSDAVTGKKLQGSIDFKWGGECPEEFSVGLGRNGEDRLVAPNVPIGMVVESPGYETWVYPKGSAADAGTFVLRPEEVLTLDLRLKPKY